MRKSLWESLRFAGRTRLLEVSWPQYSVHCPGDEVRFQGHNLHASVAASTMAAEMRTDFMIATFQCFLSGNSKPMKLVGPLRYVSKGFLQLWFPILTLQVNINAPFLPCVLRSIAASHLEKAPFFRNLSFCQGNITVLFRWDCSHLPLARTGFQGGWHK